MNEQAKARCLMYLADPKQDAKTAEQVLLEVYAILSNAPEPITSDHGRHT